MANATSFKISFNNKNYKKKNFGLDLNYYLNFIQKN